ncbi:TPA: hypothetical protein ACVU5P_004192 [Vibrio parahaemolyticus]
MRSTDRLEKALNGFERFKRAFHERAVAEAIYSEKHINFDGDVASRRPLVIYKDTSNAQKWKADLESWNSYVDIIHTRAPTHFPKGSTDLKTPEERKDVIALKVYKNAAITSRKLESAVIIRRLKELIRDYEKSLSRGYNSEKEAICQRAKNELKYFEENQDEEFRLRNEGYHEILVHITYRDKTEEKLRINEVGLFIEPAEFGDIKVTLPSDSQRRARSMLYEGLTPVETVLPYVGRIYREKDIAAAKKARDNSKK